MRSERPPKVHLRQLLDDELARHELIGSRVVRIETPSANHERLALRAAELLRRQLSGRPWQVLRNAVVRVGDAHVLRPDVMVAFRAPGAAADAIGEPAIVVEVMSPTTAVRDHGAKRLAYFQIPDLQHYVLVSSGQYCVEIFSRCTADECTYRRYCEDLTPASASVSTSWRCTRASISTSRAGVRRPRSWRAGLRLGTRADPALRAAGADAGAAQLSGGSVAQLTNGQVYPE
jgi:Uma2 family endonuclease